MEDSTFGNYENISSWQCREDKVLTAWQSLKMMPNESIDKYIEKFWDAHLKATVYQNISWWASKSNSFWLACPTKWMSMCICNSPSLFIHHALVASQINFNDDIKPSQSKATGEQKGKGVQTQNASKAQTVKKTKNQERGYKDKARLTLEQMEQYRKENKCYKCGETGHVSCVCPTKKSQNGTPKASTVEVLKEEGSSKGACLTYGERYVSMMLSSFLIQGLHITSFLKS